MTLPGMIELPGFVGRPGELCRVPDLGGAGSRSRRDISGRSCVSDTELRQHVFECAGNSDHRVWLP